MRLRAYISPDEWHYNLLALLAFFLPLYKRIVPLIIAFMVVVLMVKALRKKTQLQRISPVLLLMLGLAVLLLAYYPFTRYPEFAKDELEYKASFLVFPLIAFFFPRIQLKQLERIADVFLTGCIAFLLISIVRGIFKVIETNDLGYLSYQKLSWVFHPTYMAMYQCLAVAWLFKRGQEMRHFFGRIWLHWAIGVVMMIYVGMLASKAGIICAVLMMGYLVWLDRHNRLNLINALINSGVLVAALGISLLANPVSFQRFLEAKNDIVPQQAAAADHGAQTSTAVRKVTWAAAWEVMWKHPMGAGIGNTTPMMVAIYQAKGEVLAAEENLPAHNQFLQTGAEFGWLGFLIILAMALILVKQAIRRGHVLFKVFVGLCIFNFLFESCLETQAGIVFFSYWVLVFSKTTEQA